MKKINEDNVNKKNMIVLPDYISSESRLFLLPDDSIYKEFKGNLLHENRHVIESNLLDDIWVNRPKIHNKKVFLLPNKVCLHGANKKCEKTIKYIKSRGYSIKKLEDLLREDLEK